MTPVRRVDTAEALLEAAAGHPVVRLDVGAGMVAPAWSVHTSAGWAVAFSRRSDHGVPGAAALGDAAGLDLLFAAPRVQEWFHTSGAQHLSVPRRHQPVVARHLDLGERGGDWDWMWTTQAPPPVPREDEVETLDPRHRDALVALLTAHSPRTHGQPFARPDQHWVGVRGADGEVLACGAAEPSEAGTPTLAGIAVRSDLRRSGLGAAVTARLTRWAVARVGACALGMFADNEEARRVYHRLGFTTGMEWRSRWLAPPPSPEGPR